MVAAGCVALALAGLTAGCESPWVECTIVNRQTTPVSLVEVNYPGGSFGVQTIAAGAVYHYRFHALSTDTLSIDFMDAARQSRSVKGPELEQGSAGTLQIEIQPGNQVRWTPAVTVKK